MKKTFKIAFIVSLSLFIVFAALFAVSVAFAAGEQTSSVGIIGGADGPTAIFVTKTLLLGSPMFYVPCILFIAVIVSAVGWAASKKK